MEKKLIYCVDDEESIREVYNISLPSANYDVKTFAMGDELISEVKATKPSLIILDIMLEGSDGYEVLKKLKQDAETSDIPVIMVSAKTAETDKVKGLNLGADDYISKPFGVLELLARVNAKLRNDNGNKSVIRYRDIEINDNTHKVQINGKSQILTLKQYELLKLLTANAGKVIERNVILDKIWGINYGETRTLDIHIAELRKYINFSNCKIETIRGVGYILI